MDISLEKQLSHACIFAQTADASFLYVLISISLNLYQVFEVHMQAARPSLWLYWSVTGDDALAWDVTFTSIYMNEYEEKEHADLATDCFAL